MHWVRLRLKFGAALGLLALTLQLLISFGHVHSYAASASPTQALSLAEANVEAQKIASNDGDELPGQDDFCAICALIHLSGSALHHSPPALALLQPSAPATHAASLETIQLESVPASFHARAPPTG
jgi:hypothetical protein